MQKEMQIRARPLIRIGVDLGPFGTVGSVPDIAGALRKFVDEGVSSIQIHLDRTTPETIERLAPMLEVFDAD